MDTVSIELSFWLIFFIIPAIPWVFLLYLALDKGLRSGFSDIYWKKGVYGAFPMFALSLITFYAHFTTPDSEVKDWYHGFCFIWSCGAGFLAGDLIAFGVLFKILGPAVFLDWIFFAVLVVFLVTFGFLAAALMQGHWARRYWKRIACFAVASGIVIVPQVQIIVGRFYQNYFLFDWGFALGILR